MTTAWPDERKTAELRAKLSSLAWEFDRWRLESVEGAGLRKHHTQIDRVTRGLDALRLRIEANLDGPPKVGEGGGKDLDRAIDIEHMILDVHRIWEFFRSKLSQHEVPWFEPFLVAADQYAWDCYDPVRKVLDEHHVAPEAVREPPLIFLNGGWSPFTMTRGIEYDAEYVPDEAFPAAEYREVLQSLPLPVIGLPWYQLAHLPDVVLVGHEVAHAVQDDFRLTARLDQLLAAGLDAGKVKDDRRPAWKAWLGELFADVFGVLAGGPAFVSALLDLVAAPVDAVETEVQASGAWSIYPTRALRAHVALVALEATGFGKERATLEARWKATWPGHAMGAFEPDANEIVKSLIDTHISELSGSALREALSFATPAAATATAEANLAGGLSDLGTTDARALLALARLRFDASPVAYVKQKVETKVLDAIRSGQDRKTRAVEAEATATAASTGVRGAPAVGAPERPAPDAAATALGDSLFDRLAGIRTRVNGA